MASWLVGGTPVTTRGSNVEQQRSTVASVAPRAAWLVALVWTIATGAILGASLKGAVGLPLVLSAFALTGFGEYVVSALRDREGGRAREVTWEISEGVLRVEGERPLRVSDITAALRSDSKDDGSTLIVLDRRGHVALRLTGNEDDLDAIRDALDLDRATLPVARDPRRLAFLLAPVLAAVVVAFGAPMIARTFYGIVASVLALSPLLHLRPRGSVKVGVDGIVLEGRYVPFADIEAIDVAKEFLAVKEKNGTRTDLELAYAGSVDEVLRRWNGHLERSETRDETEMVRRRIAIEDTDASGEQMPYRARIEASPDELRAALLDSAETPSVRLSAAKRLARVDGPDAARVRDEVEEQVVDPDVTNALRQGGSPRE